MDRLCPPLGESALIQALVASYLQHDGFVETAKAFAEDIKAENIALENGRSQASSQFDFLEDGDATNRQSTCTTNTIITTVIAQANASADSFVYSNTKCNIERRYGSGSAID